MLLNDYTVTEDFIYCRSPVENLVALLKNNEIAPMAPFIKEGERKGHYFGAWVRRIEDREGNKIGELVRIRYSMDTPDNEIRAIYSAIEKEMSEYVKIHLRESDTPVDRPDHE